MTGFIIRSGGTLTDVADFDPFMLKPEFWPGFVPQRLLQKRRNKLSSFIQPVTGFEHGLTPIIESKREGYGLPYKLRFARMCAALSLSEPIKGLAPLMTVTTNFHERKEPLITDEALSNLQEAVGSTDVFDDFLDYVDLYYEDVQYFIRTMRKTKNGTFKPGSNPNFLVLPRRIIPARISPDDPVLPHLRFMVGESPQIGETIYEFATVTEVAIEYIVDK